MVNGQSNPTDERHILALISIWRLYSPLKTLLKRATKGFQVLCPKSYVCICRRGRGGDALIGSWTVCENICAVRIQ